MASIVREHGKQFPVKVDVLVVGQTPPPVNGQTVMIEEFVNGQYQGLRLHLVRMNFSREIGEVGRFQPRKLLVLLGTLVAIAAGRVRSRSKVLYYPPAGPTMVPVLRDLFLLILTRWMFRYTAFHFHAAGLPEIYGRLPWVLKPLYHAAYSRPDLAIFTTESTSSAGAALRAERVAIVPLGIPDSAAQQPPARAGDRTPCILFMGILCESKGLLVLIEACSLLSREGIAFRVLCAGAFESPAFQASAEALLAERGLTGKFEFPGVLRGAHKLQAFQNAAIFCLPSHHYAESFGVVLIEAMSFSLPIVTTRWRGIPEVVEGGGGAFVVDPRRPDLLAQSLASLLHSPELRREMGRRNRAWFCNRYTLEQYRAGMEAALLTLRDPPTPSAAAER